MITVKASEFRRRLFSLLDTCLETGEEIRIPRKGGELRIIPAAKRKKISDLPRRPGRVVESDSLDRFSPADWRP